MKGQFSCSQLSHTSKGFHLLIWRTQSSLNYREIRAGLHCLWESQTESSYHIHQRRHWAAPVAPEPHERRQSRPTFKRRKLRCIIYTVILHVLTFHISSPVEQFHLNASYVKHVFNFTTLLHTLAKDVSKSMSVCMAQEVLYCPCKHFTTSCTVQ